MIFFATTNQHKIKELKEILNVPITSYSDGEKIDIIEDGVTFEENALIKARENYKHFKMPILCEDSGISVVALNARPGIHSARYSGINADDEKNRKKLIKEMKNKKNRTAYYTSTFVYYDVLNGKESIITATGELWGSIAQIENGNEGFGYDPIFIPDNYRETLSSLGDSIKNTISHRRKAIESLKRKLNI